MLRIPCPHCGPRDQTEFSYGGDASARRPDTDRPVAEIEWVEYLFLRSDPSGEHREYWHHTHGCRQWIRVTRDTSTHRVADVRPARGARDR